MSKANVPVKKIPTGQRIVFETNDCFHGQIKSEEQSIDSLDWERVNPATGPVYINEAKPGDALKIAIEKIELMNKGVMAAIPQVGIFGDEVTNSSIKIIEIDGNVAHFNENIKLPINPMIGVIGVAPAEGEIACGTPGSHGGNMDCTQITEGNTLYLPIFHQGALLSLGDVHACMGDGEIMGTGIEIPAKVTIKVDVIGGMSINEPLLETQDMFYAVVSADTLENAIKNAAKTIRDLLIKKYSMDKNTAGMLLSAAGDTRICQVVDPLVTVRFGISKNILDRI